MQAAFFRPLKPVPLHAQRLQIGVLASDRRERRPIAFVEIAVGAYPCATVPVCLREFRHASKANRRIAGIIRSVRDPVFVSGCDSGVDRSGFGSRRSFEGVRPRSRTGDQTRRRVDTRRLGRSIIGRRSAARRAVLIPVCHRLTSLLSSPARRGNLPSTSKENLFHCTGIHRCEYRDQSDRAARQSLMVPGIDQRQVVQKSLRERDRLIPGAGSRSCRVEKSSRRISNVRPGPVSQGRPRS